MATIVPLESAVDKPKDGSIRHDIQPGNVMNSISANGAVSHQAWGKTPQVSIAKDSSALKARLSFATRAEYNVRVARAYRQQSAQVPGLNRAFSAWYWETPFSRRGELKVSRAGWR